MIKKEIYHKIFTCAAIIGVLSVCTSCGVESKAEPASTETNKYSASNDIETLDTEESKDITDKRESVPQKLFVPSDKDEVDTFRIPDLLSDLNYDYGVEEITPLKPLDPSDPFVDSIYRDGDYLVMGWKPYEGASGYDILYAVGFPEETTEQIEGGKHTSQVYNSQNSLKGIKTLSSHSFRVYIPSGGSASVVVRPRNATTPVLNGDEDIDLDRTEWRTIDPMYSTFGQARNYICASCLSAEGLCKWAENQGYDTYREKREGGTYILLAVPDKMNTAFELVSESILDSVPKDVLKYFIGKDEESESLADAVDNSIQDSIIEGVQDYLVNDYNIYINYFYPDGREDLSAKRCRVSLPYNNRKNFGDQLAQNGTDMGEGVDPDRFYGKVEEEENTIFMDYNEYSTGRRIFMHYDLNSEDARWELTIYSKPIKNVVLDGNEYENTGFNNQKSDFSSIQDESGNYEEMDVPEYILGTYDAIGDKNKTMVIKNDGKIRYLEGTTCYFFDYTIKDGVLIIDFDSGVQQYELNGDPLIIEYRGLGYSKEQAETNSANPNWLDNDNSGWNIW